ncbi:MAG: SDR family oxidoreductase [Deltaproteobacteria bacterium]|nr:SDR family oxidoreductase [Deltaproteobacteria bacterium]
MKIVVFGATGGTGRHLVTQALAAGHDVTAFARTPSKVGVQHEKLRVAQGDVRDAASVSAAIAGQDAVISAIGPPAGQPPGDLISAGVKNILAGMAAQGVKRFVFESGIMVGEGRGLNFFFKFMMAIFRRMNHALYLDKVIAERDIQATSLEWTIVRPVSLKELPARGSYQVGPDLPLNLSKPMAQADVAACLLAVATGDQFVRGIVETGY